MVHGPQSMVCIRPNSTASGLTPGSTQQVSLPAFTSIVPPPGRLELKGNSPITGKNGSKSGMSMKS